MYEKNLNIGYLLDFYGDVLSERKRNVMDMYYNEDMSLSEIAESLNITRQGARDLIKKAEEEIYFLEEKLSLAQKMSALRHHADNMVCIANSTEIPQNLKEEIEAISKIIK